MFIVQLDEWKLLIILDEFCYVFVLNYSNTANLGGPATLGNSRAVLSFQIWSVVGTEHFVSAPDCADSPVTQAARLNPTHFASPIMLLAGLGFLMHVVVFSSSLICLGRWHS